jgi:hypothetical protein
MNDLEEGIQVAIENGASGISLFGKVDEKVLEVLRKFKS